MSLIGRVFAMCVALAMMEANMSYAMADNAGEDFQWVTEQFADLRILRYQVPRFNELSLEQKKLAYYLAQAGLAGRDMHWDQNYKHNLTIRRLLEQVVENYSGDRDGEVFQKILVYAKRVFFANGIHHHYSNDKIVPEFSDPEFREIFARSPSENYPLSGEESTAEFLDRIIPIMCDPTIAPKKVCLDDSVEDKVSASAVNFYDGVTQAEVDEYFATITDKSDPTPISYGLNTKKMKIDGKVVEIPYNAYGLYGEAMRETIKWLRLALTVTENQLQYDALSKLIEYYETGDLRKFDEYNILWVQDTVSVVDAVIGFIEVYNDPMGRGGSYESVVSIKDIEATRTFGKLSDEAGWFEKYSPIAEEHKREEVKGVSYKIITVVHESGDSSPATPIGINLPNADWIRSMHGSKSVSLGNIEGAYDKASQGTVLDEFFLPEQASVIRRYGEVAGRLHTGLHEVIGHASGKLEANVAPPHETLKQYASALEEARADLVALYYIGDAHIVDIGVSPHTDVMKSEYNNYITNGLLKQLARLELGKNLEEAHMRNRQLISKWVYEQGLSENIVERIDRQTEEGVKTYFVVNDFEKCRNLFGQLLREIQRIKSQGDFSAGRALVEGYGVIVDTELHQQVKRRWAKLNIAPYAGFINPQLLPIEDNDGNIIDVVVDYPTDFTKQMLYYGRYHSFLPNYPSAQ